MRRVFVTGIGCVSPLGLNAVDTWNGVVANKSGIRRIDDFDKDLFWGKWNPDTIDLTCKIGGNVQCGGTMKGDSRVSRGTMFAAKATNEALLGAGIDLSNENIDKDLVGVSLGTGMSCLPEIAEATRALDNGKVKHMSPFFVPKILCNAAASHISIQHKLCGPNHSASTACATGAHSIGDAFRQIKYGYADMMLCGGTEASLNPIAYAGFQRAKAMSTTYNDHPETASRPFDKNRDGFVMSEGAAVLILESYESLLRRRATTVPLAEIVGFGSSADGYHVTSPHPESLGMRKCMKHALKEASSCANQPIQLQYINAHSTSTPVGDELELQAIKDIPEAFHNGNIVKVSSTKGHFGHLLGAAGAIEAMVTVKALETGLAPGTLNLEDPCSSNEGINFVREPEKLVFKKINDFTL
eukprot:TRINITY_DN10803_c0_g1_i2.p1 TRINITY_DN10803_c0_g1~~TRINITY_DN10803_c0_g1_i2.p1  ORF type:complete len:413 (+),score=51.71 TRINITY_DN10803_c0_g1_i2:49-1287(+)